MQLTSLTIRLTACILNNNMKPFSRRIMPMAKKVASKKVVIYSTPKCPICKRAKAYLTKKGITYKDIDMSANEEAAHEMIHRSGQMGTPVIFVDDQMMLGFNQKKMDEMLAK